MIYHLVSFTVLFLFVSNFCIYWMNSVEKKTICTVSGNAINFTHWNVLFDLTQDEIWDMDIIIKNVIIPWKCLLRQYIKMNPCLNHFILVNYYTVSNLPFFSNQLHIFLNDKISLHEKGKQIWKWVMELIDTDLKITIHL